MGISNNSPTMSYIHISGISVVWNNETYMVQDFATNKRYIYWNSDTPHQLNASNVMPNRSTKQYLVIVNDNGMHTLVPPTSDDFSISFEGNSNQAIKDRIFGLYSKNDEFENQFVAIEQDIDGIRSIVGTTEGSNDGTLIDKISKVEQKADRINLSVEEISKKYNDDKEVNQLRENLNSSIIKLNSTLGTFKSELTGYFKNNEITSEEQVKIQAQLEILTSEKTTLEGYVNIIKLIAENNNQVQDVAAIESAKNALQIAHDNLHNNIANAVIDSIITPTENTIVIDSFAKYSLRVNELKNTCDDIIMLGIGGVITEELANISIKSDEVKLSVSKVEQIASSLQGKMLYTDSTFKEGYNEVKVYNNSVNGTVSISRIDKSSDCPTTSSHMLEIKTTGLASPHNGGFYFGTNTRANAIFITKIMAKLPVDTEITFHTNNIGDNGKQEWLTSTEGTGNWKEYICKVTCGTSGEFSSTNFFALKGGSIPVTWYVAMATVFDATDSSNIESRLTTAESKITDKAIIDTVSKSFYTKEETENSITSKGYQTSSQVQQTVDGLEIKFKESGGYNLLYNGDFKRGGTFWNSVNPTHIVFHQSGLWSPDSRGVSLAGALNTSVILQQTITDFGHIDEFITVSYYTFVSSSGVDGATNPYRTGEMSIGYTDGTYSWHKLPDVTQFDTWEKRQITIEPTKRVNYIDIALYNRDTTRVVYYSSVMLEKGKVANHWTPNPNEVCDGITTIDKSGVRVSHSNINGYSEMSADSFRINKDSRDIFKVDSSGLRILDGDIQVSHSDGSYTKMSYDGFKRYRISGDAKGDYHYLTQYIGFSGQDTVWVQLKDDFKGKNFTAYSVISDTWEDSWNHSEPWVVQRFVTYVQTDNIDYENARVPVLIYRIDKNYKTGEHRKKPCAGVLLVVA